MCLYKILIYAYYVIAVNNVEDKAIDEVHPTIVHNMQLVCYISMHALSDSCMVFITTNSLPIVYNEE